MGRNLVIYLDTCIYGRPFDRPTTPEIRAEAAAVDAIIKWCKAGGHRIIGSATVTSEIGQIANPAKRAEIEAFYYKNINGEVMLSTQGIKRMLDLKSQGLGDMDSQHLTTAETAGADFLLTTDKFFIKRGNSLKLYNVKIMNPTNFVKEGYLK
ncbi:MAG: hypothetical protein LBB74_01060 [Chitinispirillales bacterium]|nr:hypothetical protein [Chitinispirillales bacterium]